MSTQQCTALQASADALETLSEAKRTRSYRHTDTRFRLRLQRFYSAEQGLSLCVLPIAGTMTPPNAESATTKYDLRVRLAPR